ncbi:MAG: hypothetical protein ACRDRU_29135 [Pseudonocardiaceae bacterium]
MKVSAADRERRLHQVFGDVVPDNAPDDRPDKGDPERDRWFQENRPPHHDTAWG